MQPHDLSFLEVPLQEYIYYGCLDLTMKWLDFGDADDGFTLYRRSPRYTTQGLLVQRPDQATEPRGPALGAVPLARAWPELGQRRRRPPAAYRRLVRRGRGVPAVRQGPLCLRRSTAHREALAIRSLGPAVRNAPATLPLPGPARVRGRGGRPVARSGRGRVLALVAEERVPDRPRRPARHRGRAAYLHRCREMGVPISLFVSHHILRDTDETDPDWLHRNKTGQAVVWNWTYSSDYIPKFPVLFAATHSMVGAPALSLGWRETGLNEYRRAVDLGAESICFDVFYAWGEPTTARAPTASPTRRASGSSSSPVRPGGSSASDARRAASPASGRASSRSWSWTTWDWRNAYDVADCAPFRYVFPQFRLNANVGAHPRGPAVAFMEDALLNVMPGGLLTERLADHPRLVDLLRRLTTLRHRFLPFFTEGRFRHLEAGRRRGR